MLALRLQMVKLAQDKGICESARLYNTPVRKCASGLLAIGKKGFRDLQIERGHKNIFLIRPQKR